MCIGLILKDGTHLQTVKQVEDYFGVDLSKYAWSKGNGQTLIRDYCLCQVNLEKFMNEPERKDKFKYDYIEYYEK